MSKDLGEIRGDLPVVMFDRPPFSAVQTGSVEWYNQRSGGSQIVATP